MGRYPFLTSLKSYIDDCKHRKSENTLWQEERTLRRIHNYFQELKEEGRVTSASPKNITQKDCKELLFHVRQKGLHINTQAKYSNYLLSFLNFCGNTSMAMLRARGELPKAVHDQEIRTLTEDEVARILDVATTLEGWEGDAIHFATRFYYYTGLRPKELRMAHLVDLNTVKWTFFIRHPKGERSWGKKATIPLLQELKPYVLDYLDKREQRLKELGITDCEALIPHLNRHYSKGGFYRAGTLVSMRHELVRKSGVDYDFRILRRSCGQHLRDRGVPIDIVSKILRHKTTRTTELYYARIRDSQAYEEVQDAWSRRPLASQPEMLTSLIELKAR